MQQTDGTPPVSVIVRTFDSVETVADVLTSIRSQTVTAEIVVVDSGSTDGTLEVAQTVADRVVELPASEFTFGRSLNLGAEAATAPVHVALSSHCALPHERWLEVATRHIADGAVATGGAAVDGDRHPLDAPLRADHDYLASHPNWGISNHASAWSASAWEDEPFDETLPAAEDREWSLRVLTGDRYVVLDPALHVPADHRRTGGAREYFERLLREMESMDGERVREPFGLTDAVREWRAARPRDGFLSDARPCGRTRLIEVAARYVAGRRVRRRA